MDSQLQPLFYIITQLLLAIWGTVKGAVSGVDSGEGRSIVESLARSTIFLQNHLHASTRRCSQSGDRHKGKTELRRNTLIGKGTFFSAWPLHYNVT